MKKYTIYYHLYNGDLIKEELEKPETDKLFVLVELRDYLNDEHASTFVEIGDEMLVRTKDIERVEIEEI